MNIEVSTGEVLDKLSILDVKLRMIKDETKRQNVLNERLSLLDAVYADQSVLEWMGAHSPLLRRLFVVNRSLWNIEERLREKEAVGRFDDEFVQLARQVYTLNDERAAIKKDINIQTQSRLIEEKEYHA